MSKKNYPQIGVRIPQDLIKHIDDLVKQGLFPSKSNFVRRAIETMLFLKGKLEDPPISVGEKLQLNKLLPTERIKYIESLLNIPIVSYAYGYQDIEDMIKQKISDQVKEFEKVNERNDSLSKLLAKFGATDFYKYAIYYIINYNDKLSEDTTKEYVLAYISTKFSTDKIFRYNLEEVNQKEIYRLLNKMVEEKLISLVDKIEEPDIVDKGGLISIGIDPSPSEKIYTMTHKGIKDYSKMDKEFGKTIN